MTSETGVIIVGAGESAGSLAFSLRQQGYSRPIVLIGDESHPPYRRPPLSKAFLAGEVSAESLYLRSADSYARQNIELRLGLGVEAIDRAARSVTLFDGEVLSYDRLVLATGGHARRLLLPGADHPNVHYVRTITDIERLKKEFLPGKRLVVVGGGYIGLEVAAIGIKKGLGVTVIESLPRVLARVTAPEVSAFYERVHSEQGVKLLTHTGVEAFDGDPRVTGVRLGGGAIVPADIVVVGIGLVPNVELATAAGLLVDNGIVVDALTRSSDENIFAIGDCANHENSFLGRRLRMESVASAVEQARICAAAICEKPAPRSGPPWFWSDQYDLKLQMVGISQGYEQLAIRGDINGRSFSAFYLHDGEIIAIDTVNRTGDFAVGKRLLAAHARAEVAQLADESFELKSLLPA
ncbi:MAG: FAD-dependent oxidoreductase [Steroidobacteraceae bacterium]